MGASWVIPRKGDKMVLISAQFSFEENDGYFLLQGRAEQVTTDWEKKTMGDSWVIPTTIPALPCPALPCSRKHSLSRNLNHFVYFSRNHPGSTHE